ncbi:hypothetical protein DXG01_006583 [Tephrocybe rancida]|nr:hypothetical protein DXG01_006583 [Tephrocybe rancida]
MVLKQSVVDAFNVLGVSPEASTKDAATAYKKLALKHHPDRNHGDSSATERFQKIGAAWDIITRHYEDPQRSEQSAPGWDDYDDEIDESDLAAYYDFMFYEMFREKFGFGFTGFNSYSRNGRYLGRVFPCTTKLKRPSLGFRTQRQSSYGPSYTSYYAHPFERNPSHTYAGSRPTDYESNNERMQKREKEKAEQRIREFELECAAEERAEAEAERERILKAEQQASAQAEAFALARAGDSEGVQRLVERHSLDIKGPEKVPKQAKKTPPTNFNTLLHVAASKCDEDLVMFLLDKGADMAALNKDGLSPFHQSILSGNTPVVRFFLSRRGKSFEGCHPSKAVADGRTPLRLAIASNSVPTVQLLLKDATVHDVERCWEQQNLPVALKDVLETKKGFVPLSMTSNGAPLSRKAALKAEAARKLAAGQEEKARKIAEERARAAENLRKKEERAAKRAEEERVREAIRVKLEEEERQRAQEATLAAEQVRREVELEERRKVEEARRITVEVAERQRVEEEERQRAQYEARQRAEAEARRKAEMDARRRIEQEERRKILEMEARQRLEAETRQREMERQAQRHRQAELQREAELTREAERQREVEARRREAEIREQEAEARRREADERQRARVEALAAAKAERDAQAREAKEQAKKAAASASRRPVMDPVTKRAETLRRLQAQAEEHERLKRQRQQATPQSVALSAPPPHTADVAADPKMEAIMRKRAEQSARDKARHQCLKEEKALLESAKLAESGLDPAAVVDAEAYKKRRTKVKKVETTTSAHHQSTYPLTPVSMSSSPLSWLAEPSHGTSKAKAAPPTPPMTPEDLQTCAIPEDLFAYVPPKAHTVSSPSPSPASPTPVSQRGRGYGLSRGRGCARGRGGKKDRPPPLDIPADERKAASDGEIRYAQPYDNRLKNQKAQQPSLHISLAEEDPPPENDYPVSRSTSVTSTLDPYYFGIRSPTDSPVPPLPLAPMGLSTTPEQRHIIEPVTPARDPATIDRRGLVGVGELTTPRWTRTENYEVEPTPVLETPKEIEEYEVVVPNDVEEDGPDSPWTIEAVDGEPSEKEDPTDNLPPPRPLRNKPSLADESGGEEILYPRQPPAPIPDIPAMAEIDPQEVPLSPAEPKASEGDPPSSPPSAYVPSVRKAKKRTSGEFEMDQFGALVSKQRAASQSSKDEKASVRKHRSLNVSTSSSSSTPREYKGKERRRESVGLTINSSLKSPPTKTPERHARHTSSGSSGGDFHSQRRVHPTDFSHLPPSPSSSSIQQFLRHPPTSASNPPSVPKDSKDSTHALPSVGHSILRGTQEGWSVQGNEAAFAAMQKLDGLTGKTARSRASVGSFVRSASSSRPGTPSGKSAGQWEGVGTVDSGKAPNGNVKDAVSFVKEREPRQSIGLGIAMADVLGSSNDLVGTAISSDEFSVGPVGTEKTPKKAGTSSARSSFTPKRGSTSSTTYTSTPSSRDSVSMSANTSLTSVSAASSRYSTNKTRRNSAGSDISSIHSSDAASLKDRVAALVNGDAPEDTVVPPVPPLPKDLSNYRSPPGTAGSLNFPQPQSVEERERVVPQVEKIAQQDSIQDRAGSLEVPVLTSTAPPTTSSPHGQSRRLSQHYNSGYSSTNSAPASAPAAPKTPSKKWSFSSALNLNFSSSPSSSSSKSGFPLSPKGVTFGQQVRKSTSKDQGPSSNASSKSWETKQPEAMVSAGSLASLSSVGSVRTPALPSASSTSKTPDRSHALSRTGTGSSGDTNHTTSGLSVPQSGPLSPASSVRRGQSKRLTPSSIPFFRRSSSQSMQLPPSQSTAASSSPTLSSGPRPSTQGRQRLSTPPRDQHNPPSTTSILGSQHKKSSVLSLGLPSLLKSSSRRSLHSDSKETAKELQKLKDAEKERVKQEKVEKERQKKEDKDRSESRISVLMGGVTRKRGKTLSSSDHRKPKSPVTLPPMHMSALEPATAQRVARLKPSSNSTSTPVAQGSVSRTASSTSRLTSQTVSSMQKHSDSSLRSRNQLPTIAGSPSVGTNGTSSSQTMKEFREGPSMMNSVASLSKETPTKIPRISSRTSAAASPPLKGSGSALSMRRTSAAIGVGEPGPSSANPSPSGTANEFGVMELEETPAKTLKHSSIRASPSVSTSRVPRQSLAATTTSSVRKANRDSVSYTARKASTSSVTSMSTPAAANETSTHHHRFSALSPSKLKLLAPKISLPSARSSTLGQGIHQAMGSPSSSRQSLSTPSPAPSTVDEEELLGDEEMMHYIRRQQAKKMAAGATQEELDELLQFPEPLPPGTPASPSSVLRNSAQYLSDYERKEILDYPSVYCFGAKSKKKPATVDLSTNNYGYDDERGDYLVVAKDHLAYRYEIIDTLGKGSFGQVLQCRDHCTGESVAVKIIRNKKRFHHQALVEIKILDNLRKWDSDGTHHVLRMIEHFYFRNHLCIATELLSINLYELIKANGFVGFTTALIRRFTSQMLMSLSLMRHHHIVHCDLKPESRFYRSPEVILGLTYSMAIDMWSLGCILAELYTGFPIFPGENEQEQLSCIMEVLGVPDREYINRSTRKKLFFGMTLRIVGQTNSDMHVDLNGAPRAVINSKGRRRKPGSKNLQQVLRCTDEDFLDFISKCLVWDPERRIKPQAAMRHPFIASGKRLKPPPSATKTTASSSSLSSSRANKLNETPKKSLIGAPTPLTARTARTTVAAGGPSTPSSSSHAAATLGSTSRSYRSSQSQGLSSYSSRTLNGFASTTMK